MPDDFEQRIINLIEENEEFRNKLVKAINKQKRSQTQSDKKEKLSRRSFLKKAAGGVAGLSAATLLPYATAFDIESDQGFNFFDSSENTNFSLNKNGVLDTNQIGTSQKPVRSIATNSFESLDSLNNIGTPDPSENGKGISEALEKYDTVYLKPGEYTLDEPIRLEGNQVLRGAGHRGQTVLRPTNSFPRDQPMLYTGQGISDQTKFVLSGIYFYANGRADDGIQVTNGDTDFVIRECMVRYCLRDGIRVKGGFNGLVERTRIRNCSRIGLLIGDRNDLDEKQTDAEIYRASSMCINKCHIGRMGSDRNTQDNRSPQQETYWETGMGIAIGPGEFSFDVNEDGNDEKILPYYNESDQATPGTLIINSDISSNDIGLYCGRYSSNVTILQGDFEYNDIAGVKIGTEDMKPYMVRNYQILGSNFVNNTIGIDASAGRGITIQSVREIFNDSKRTVEEGIRIGSQVKEDSCYIRTDEAEIDSGIVVNNKGYLSQNQAQGSYVAATEIEVRRRDLTSVKSKGVRLAYHDGSGTAPEGMYRGDDNKGWIKLSDNSVTINASKIS